MSQTASFYNYEGRGAEGLEKVPALLTKQKWDKLLVCNMFEENREKMEKAFYIVIANLFETTSLVGCLPLQVDSMSMCHILFTETSTEVCTGFESWLQNNSFGHDFEFWPLDV